MTEPVLPGFDAFLPPQGPAVELLTRRLAQCPPDFADAVAVGAILADVLEDAGHDLLPAEWHDALAPRQPEPAQRSWVQATAILAWLLADPAVGPIVPTAAVLELLRGDLHELTLHVPAAALVTDSDRREELARLLLRAAGTIPAGETPAQAADRLATLDTVTRLRVVADARAAEARAHAVRDALAAHRAREAAARAMRE